MATEEIGCSYTINVLACSWTSSAELQKEINKQKAHFDCPHSKFLDITKYFITKQLIHTFKKACYAFELTRISQYSKKRKNISKINFPVAPTKVSCPTV